MYHSSLKKNFQDNWEFKKIITFEVKNQNKKIYKIGYYKPYKH